MKIAIGSDHAGYELKQKVIQYLSSQDIEIQDFGTFSTDSVDYPDFAHPTASAVEKAEVDYGILLCGSGNGVAMVANKHQGVRAGLCWTPELAQLTRQHNDANILVVPARFTSEDTALQMVKVFLETEFEGGRHLNRVNKIPCA